MAEERGSGGGAPAHEEESETPEASEQAAATAVPEQPLPGGRVLRGATVSPGLVLGRVHRKDYDLNRTGAERVARDEVDQELNRFRSALDDSRRQLLDLKERLTGRVPEEDARILDTHIAYLRDSVFIADVEELILGEQMRLDAAIAKVVGDFDRIFRLVESETLRQSAVDLRDVGIRVLRNLERPDEGGDAEPRLGSDVVLVAKELSIVDMFDLTNEQVRGIVAEEGALTSHAAIFARSMSIPTLIGVEGVLDAVSEGDFVILDATEGLLRVEPDEVVRAQYTCAVEEGPVGIDSAVPEWALRPSRTRDGLEIELAASCGNLPEVEQARAFGLEAIGLYRTELLYLIDKAPPSRESLVQHYSSVIGAAKGAPVTFRLLNVDSSVGLPYLHPEKERNPSLGLAGIRALLARPAVLRRQLQALLVAGVGANLRIAVPFVTDCGCLRRVREILFEERFELRKSGEDYLADVDVGVVIETPAAMLGIGDLAAESDFLLLNLDSLQQFLLAMDRDDAEQGQQLETVHPFVLRAVKKASEVAEREARPLSVFGVAARRAENLPFLIGAGLRRFCVPPADLRGFLDSLAAIDSRTVVEAALAASRSSCAEETRSLVSDYHHGQRR
ncbi:MAG TPA: phosphoenolpyruvate--protein phosphotransferase [Planctomycetes bacterium]|nr:phosphoenolpyruvate--protein phosphotransferase [Planctomycetota bacterium]